MKPNFFSTIIFAVGLAAAEQSTTPLPLQFKLPLPQGQSMTFRMVPVSRDDNPFSSFEFNIGASIQTDSEEGSFRNRLTPTSVSGSVYLPASFLKQDTGCWVLPMGETEVTRMQYAAVMGLPLPGEEEKNQPQTEVSTTEVQMFCDRLNSFLLTDAKAKKLMEQLTVSKKHGTPFVRLPLENEWEFVARGGTCVDERSFAAAQPPYMEKENLGGASVSINNAGRSGAQNACGVHDMLGNVQELVQGEFCPEYNYGRAGGLLVRGGCYITPPREVFAYTRREFAPYTEEGKPYSSKQVGFRVALGSTISADTPMSFDDLCSAWVAFWKDHVSHRPGEGVTDSLNTKLEAERDDLRKQLAALKDTLDNVTHAADNEGSNETLLRETSDRLTDMTARLQQMENRVSRSQAVQAQSAMVMIYYASAAAAQNSAEMRHTEKRVAALKALGASAEDMEAVKLKAQVLQDNVATYWEQFARGCEALKEVDEAVVKRQEAERAAEISRKAAADKNKGQQVEVFRLAMQHYRNYLQSGRLSVETRDAWYSDLSKL